ncbi:MAG: FAD-binding oxidoreductase [Anaerolineales bacterium]|nr:FAD-binding oxidoreductase [Anaerolineales bacterium]
MIKTTPFWTEETPRPADLHTVELPDAVDVAVIGSGYTGLHAALALRAAGATVAVLEQETIGWGASSRNGGMATTGLKEDMSVVFKRYGSDKGRQFWAWALASIDYLEHTVRTEGINCNFQRSGHVTLACKQSHFDHFAEEVAWFRSALDYQDTWVVSKNDLRTEIGTNEYFGGLVDRNSAAVQPARYVFGLAEAAARRGAHLVEHAQVTGMMRRRGRFFLGTTRGKLEAREVLLATNGYTTNLVPAARQGIFPVGSYIIVTAPLPEALQLELSPRSRMFFDSKNFLNYFRITPDGRMLFGGRHNLSTGLDLMDSARMMQARMIEVFPQLSGTPLTHTWTGKLGICFDLMPHLGRVGGVHYAYGYAGHGVSVAGYLGKEAGEMLAGKRTSSLLSEITHPRYPFTPYDRIYLPIVSNWYRFKDAIG